jgi:hypothetical protein
MISNVSSTLANSSVQPNPAVKLVPSSSNQGATSNGDTVQLSPATQQHLASARSSTSTQPETISEIIKEAAGGDISAIAKLALIG